MFIDNARRMLCEFGVSSGTRLKCDDFLQEFNIVINVFDVWVFLFYWYFEVLPSCDRYFLRPLDSPVVQLTAVVYCLSASVVR